MLEIITKSVTDRTARGVAAGVSRLVVSGDLPAGTRLPPVRQLAAALGISPTTVSQAWRTLARAGVISARGRNGTVVNGVVRGAAPRRYRRLGPGSGPVATDLSTGMPDPDLLPALTPVLARVSGAHLTASYLDPPLLPALESRLRERWPFPPEALTVVDGATDALDRLITQLVPFGSRVLVESPTFPPLLDLLDGVGAEVIGLPLDDEGVLPAALQAALDADPSVLFLQPRAHNPSGVSITPERARTLAGLLAGRDLIVIEDDHCGDVATAAPVSLGADLPASTAHIRSFSKSYGPDLRLAAIGGPARVVEPLATRRMLGPGWSSRLLQAVLVELLDDADCQRAIAQARDTYAARRGHVLAALAAHGVPAGSASAIDGINLWLRVEDEQVALLSLAAHGIRAAPGAPFEVDLLGAGHLRVTVGLVHDGFDELAAVLAEAAGRP